MEQKKDEHTKKNEGGWGWEWPERLELKKKKKKKKEFVERGGFKKRIINHG